jgi:hypothetical protein
MNLLQTQVANQQGYTPNPTTTVLKTKATRVRANSLAVTNKATKIKANSLEAASKAAVIKVVVIRVAATRIVTIKAATVAEDIALASTANAAPRFIVGATVAAVILVPTV